MTRHEFDERVGMLGLRLMEIPCLDPPLSDIHVLQAIRQDLDFLIEDAVFKGVEDDAFTHYERKNHERL